MSYDDYVFWDHSRGNVLATESLPARLAEDHARMLARRYHCRVAYAVVVEYFIEPARCPACGDVMPEAGPCWCSSYEEEEEAIPFQGEPMPNREIDAKSYYGL